MSYAEHQSIQLEGACPTRSAAREQVAAGSKEHVHVGRADEERARAKEPLVLLILDGGAIEQLDGIQHLTERFNRELLDSTRLGLEIAAAFQTLYPGKIDFGVCKRLIGSDDVIRRIQAGEDPRSIQQSYQDLVAGFVKLRDQYLLYR